MVDVVDTGKQFTQRYVAKKVNVRADFLNHILNDRCPCPPALAPKLEKVTGIDRKIWVWGSKKEKRAAWLRFQLKSQELDDSQGLPNE